MPLGWLTSEFLYPGSALRDTLSNSGNYCLQLVGSDTVAFASSMTVVRPGFHYNFSGFAQVVGGLGGSFMLQFLTMLGNPVGTPQLIPVYRSNGYREYSRWVTAPDSAVFLSVFCLALPGAVVCFDDVTLEDTTLLGNEEGVSPVGERIAGREKLTILNGKCRRLTEGVVYDVLGRRQTGELLGGGVYFYRDR